MGEGLYWSRDGRTAYVEPFDDLDPDDHLLWQEAWSDLGEAIASCLSDTWERVPRRWRRGGERVVMRNGLHEVWLTEDSYARVHVTFGVRDDLCETEALACATMHERAEAFFDRLTLHCDLRGPHLRLDERCARRLPGAGGGGVRIELRAIRYSASASQETAFYSADLHVDGRRIGTVSNGGTGGADVFHGDRAAYAAADAWCRADLPPWRDGGRARVRDRPRAALRLSSAAVYRHGRPAPGPRGARALARSGRRARPWVRHRGQVEETIASVRCRHPNAAILNELPFVMALAIWRQVPARPRRGGQVVSAASRPSRHRRRPHPPLGASRRLRPRRRLPVGRVICFPAPAIPANVLSAWSVPRAQCP